MPIVNWNEYNHRLDLNIRLNDRTVRNLVKQHGIYAVTEMLKKAGANAEDVLKIVESAGIDVKRKDLFKVMYENYRYEGINAMIEAGYLNASKAAQELYNINGSYNLTKKELERAGLDKEYADELIKEIKTYNRYGELK